MPTEAEWLTSKTRIDTKLGTTRPPWTIISHREGLDENSLIRHAVTEYPTSNGRADHALFVNGRLLGMIEAKRVGVDPQNVLEQVRRYARGATTGSGKWNGYRVPFTYLLFLKMPPLPEQQEIVRRVEAMFALADRIEARLPRQTRPARPRRRTGVRDARSNRNATQEPP